MKRSSADRRCAWKSRYRRPQGRRLRLEALEDRRLMALTDLAFITGTVFKDVTGDGLTPGEEITGVNLQLYRDANNNGQFDAGDGAPLTSATTDAGGGYRFSRLSAGNYFVRQPAQTVNAIPLGEQLSPLIAISAQAAQGVLGTPIDSFTTSQAVIAPFPVGTQANSSLAAPEAIGGERDMIGLFSAGANIDSVSMSSGSGRLAFDPTFGARGTYTVVWDGPDGDGLQLNPIGLRTGGVGVDLTAGGKSSHLEMSIGVDKPQGVATLRIYTDQNNWSQAVLSLTDTTGQPDLEYLIDLQTGFSPQAGLGADMTNVGAIVLEVVANVAAMDGQMTVINSRGATILTQDFNNGSQQADLSLTMTASNTTPNVGQNVTFTITVTNVGPAAATGVTVSDSLPSGLGFAGATPSRGTYDSGTGIWNIGSLAVNQSATLLLVASVTEAGSATNTAQIATADQTDPDSFPGNNSTSEDDQASVTITPLVADLSLTKTVDKPSPNIGDTVVFTVTLSNAGPNTATGVVVTDPLPAGITYVSSAASTGSYNSGTGAWSIPSLAVGSNATLQITGRIATVGDKTNTAQVTAAQQADPDSAPNNNLSTEDDQAGVVVTPQSADLSLAKTVSNATPNVGDQVTFTITLNNQGPSPASGVTVRDNLQSGLTYVSSTPSVGTFDSTTRIWNVGSLAAGSTATLKIVASVDAANTTTNAAEVASSNQVDPDSTPNNNNPREDDQASASVTPQKADLSLTKTVDKANPTVGEQVNFTLRVTNAGPDSASNIQVKDLLPEGFNFISATPSQGSYNRTTGIWVVGSLPRTGTATLQIKVSPNREGVSTNAAEIVDVDQFDPDSIPNNGVPGEDDYAAASVTPETADLSLTKSVDNDRPNVGERITFSIQLQNAGPNTTSGVTVLDALPSGLSYVSASASAGSYTSSTGIWAIGTLPSGGSATLQLTAEVTNSGAKNNTAEVTASSLFDPDSTPNNRKPDEDDQATITITPQVADLSLTKTIDVASPNVGQTVTFTLTVANAGPDAASNVAVKDGLPAGLEFITATASQGQYDNATGIWTVGAVEQDAQPTLAIQAIVATDAAKINAAEISASDQFDPDSTPGNNKTGEDDQAQLTTTPQVADLSLVKTVDAATPNVGQTVTFTLNVNNAGPNEATGVKVRDVLPEGLEFVSAGGSGGTYDPATQTWTIDRVASGAKLALQLKAIVRVPDPRTNTAEIMAADQFDPDSTPGNGLDEDDRASVTITPQKADLSLTKIVTSTAPNVGQNVTFTLSLRNDGPDAATNLIVYDGLPAGFQFVSALPSQGAYNVTTGQWPVGTVASGSTVSLQVIALVTEPGAKTNVVEVQSVDQYDPDSIPNNQNPEEDDRATVTVTPLAIDLTLVQTVNNPTPNLGENVTFTLGVGNIGPDMATNVVVTDLLPAGLTYVSSTPSQGTYDAKSGQWTVGNVAVSVGATLQIIARVDTIAPVTNTAEVTAADQFDLDSKPNNKNPEEDDQASVKLTPQLADLSLTKTVDQQEPNVGDEITFTITVNNAGPNAATNVTVEDKLPAGLTFVRTEPSQGSYTPGSGVWVIGTVEANQPATLKLVASVAEPGTKTNLAQIRTSDQADIDSVPGNSQAGEDDQAQIDITPQTSDLSVTVTASPSTVYSGSPLTYTITVRNAGPSAATNVLVKDLLPINVTFASLTTTQGQGSHEDGLVQVALGSLAAGKTATVTVVAVVNEGFQGPLSNAVSVAADQFDTDTQNDTSVLTTLAKLPPARVSGRVFLDFNDNGIQDANDTPIPGVRIQVQGKDSNGNPVSLNYITGPDGSYVFDDLPPGEYLVSEIQPEWFTSGKTVPGNSPLGVVVNPDQFFFRLGSRDTADNFNFAELFPYFTRRRALASSPSLLDGVK